MTPAATLPRLLAASAGRGDRPVWGLDGRDWPMRRDSLFLEAQGVRWHVQQYGEGPDLLLLHGAAAATHSWRGLGPLLAARHRVTALDLPGHGFSGPPDDPAVFTQRGLARAVAGLLASLEVSPAVIVGHSAGAALGAALALGGHLAPQRLISVNGALQAYHAPSGGVFPLLARTASLAPVAQMFAWRASYATVERVIANTGSTLEPFGVELYRRLFARRGHVSAAFALMGGWQDGSVLDELERLACPLTLIVADGDRAVPPSQACAVARRVRDAQVVRLSAGGHLAHEEHPAAVGELIFQALADPSSPRTPP